MRKIKIILLFLLSFHFVSKAEENPLYLLSNKAISFGIGSQKEHDSYLSPLLYDGIGFTIMSERLKYFSLRSNKISRYNEGNFQFGFVDNPARNSSMIPFTLRYFWGIHYHIRPIPNMNILVGGLWNMDLGGRLQLSNQNNPYSLTWNTNLWLSAMIYYHVPLRKRTLTFREHFSMPFVGVMFAPNYTQTYYEIFGLGHTDNTIHITSFGERLAWRNKLSMDLPTSICTFRFGFLAERITTEINGLETRSTNLSFLIGWIYNYSTFKGRKAIPEEFYNPTE